MKRLISIILILFCNLSFAQDIDTSFVIKTKNSEIKIVCKRISQNGSTQSMHLLTAAIKINQTTIEEAEKSGIKTGKYYVNLHYNSNCDLDKITTLRVSKNSSFNIEVDQYFKEFIDAYNSNDLKKYFKESAKECGGNKLIFSYLVE
jgi:hypothetical protein